MWAAEAWAKMSTDSDVACWQRQRDAPDREIPTASLTPTPTLTPTLTLTLTPTLTLTLTV